TQSGDGDGGDTQSGDGDGGDTQSGDGDGGDGDTQSGDGDGGDTQSGDGDPIPEPGTGTDSWSSDGSNGTPGTAWQVGVATQLWPYIEGVPGEDGNAYFVFEAGPGYTQIQLEIVGGPENPEFVHIHAGSGGIFGAEVTADTTTPKGGSWTVVPGELYVLEVKMTGAGFF
ncbi:MAG: hypothetical protein V3V08_13185, partial [Nannocystaceae bacterium]